MNDAISNIFDLGQKIVWFMNKSLCLLGADQITGITSDFKMREYDTFISSF